LAGGVPQQGDKGIDHVRRPPVSPMGKPMNEKLSATSFAFHLETPMWKGCSPSSRR
jgi:hypothetical protein